MGVPKKSWLRLRAENAFREGLTRVYGGVKVDGPNYLLKLQRAHSLSIRTFHDLYSVPLPRLDDIAAQTMRAGMKFAILEGAGLGVGGMLTVIPDLSFLAVITMRTIQKLSLLYGFEYNTDEEVADLWVAAASAAGVDISRDLIEKHIINRFVPRVIEAIAVQGGKEAAGKLAGRVVPVVSSAIGAGLNYLFVRGWSNRARNHFRQKHIAMREMVIGEKLLT